MITSVSRAAKSLLLGAVAVCSLQAASVTYTLSNFTFSGGDPVFSVASDITFTNIALTGMFADNALVPIPLLNAGNVAQTSLSTSTLDLTSAPFSDSSPQHGALVMTILMGSLSQTNFSIVTSFGNTPTSVTVNPNFLAVLPLSGSSVNVNATDARGNAYAIGTLDAVRSAAVATPEPGTFAVAALGLLTLVSLARRFGRGSL